MSEETRSPDRGDTTGDHDERRAEDEVRAEFVALRRELEASDAVPDFQAMVARARASDDAELGAEFSSLREGVEASGRVPDFGGMIARAKAEASAGRSSEQARIDLVRLGRWVPLAAAAAVAGLLWIGGPEAGGDDEFERLVADYSSSAASWRSPTASLMDIPGVDLGSVPSIGTSLGGIDIPDTDVPEGRDS